MPNSNINIIVEKNVPFIRGLVDPYASVRYLAPEEITPKAVENADGLVIRTRTRCDEALLGKSQCRFIATATIGTDHIDLDWCTRRGITVVNAPGCNAPAVAQYVFGSIMQTINRPISGYTIGIVGVGHVGRIVEQWARALDMKVLLCDPPRQRAEGGDGWSDLATVAREADIITFHTPLTREGEDRTFHLVGEEFLSSLRRMPILINSARGPIVDTPALIGAIDRGLVGPVVMDCWENEPGIDLELLRRCAIATPHIAGYSRDGKTRASQIAVDALTTFFMLPRVTVPGPMPKAVARAVTAAGVARTYNPMVDTAALKSGPENFEALRNGYNLREEASEGKID